MTGREWNRCTEYLENGDEGAWIENDGRTVEVVNMVGGRYMLIDVNGYIDSLVDDTWRAVMYLNNGFVTRKGL